MIRIIELIIIWVLTLILAISITVSVDEPQTIIKYVELPRAIDIVEVFTEVEVIKEIVVKVPVEIIKEVEVEKIVVVETPRLYKAIKDVDELREIYRAVMLDKYYSFTPADGDRAWCNDTGRFIQKKFAEAGYLISQQLLWEDSKVGPVLVRHDFVPHWGLTATTADHVIWYFEALLHELPQMHRIYNTR